MATATDDKNKTTNGDDELDADDEETVRRANAIPDTEPPAGKSIDDMVADGEVDEDDVEPKPLPPMKQSIPGTQQTISSSFGGTRPSRSEIRLLGGKLPIDGSFAKGEEVILMVRVKVSGVLGQDVLNDWGASTETIRRHMARMIEVRRLTPADGGGYELTDQQKIEGL